MYLESAVFENFRNIKEFSFEFSPEMNIIFGKNAQGKTNVLEGIFMFAGGKSFRHVKDRELISIGKETGSVSVIYSDSRRENKMLLRLSREKKKECVMNGMKVPRLSQFIGNFRAVLFCPSHLDIIQSDPGCRRAFCDGGICQISPAYLSVLSDHAKLLTEKNALLKNRDEYSTEEFERLYLILSESLSGTSAYISEKRSRYVEKLFSYVGKLLYDMTGGKEIVSYNYLSAVSENGRVIKSREECKNAYFALMKNGEEREKASCVSVYGAQRDDFEIMIGDMPAKVFASQGQQRSLALALKLAEGELCREETGEYPVFLFDDVLSELDRERKKYLLSRLGQRQVIITACDESDFYGISDSKKIFVENGNYYYR